MTYVLTSCKYCGKLKHEVLNHIIKKFYNRSFKIIQCINCNLITLFPLLPSSKLYSRFYHSYRSSTNGQRFSLPLDRFMKIWRNLRAARMLQLSHGGMVLDIGCGQAIELQILKKKGVKVFGLEYDFDYATTIENQTNIKIYNGKLSHIPKIRPGFALITFLHSLEHIPEALEGLMHVHSLLKKGGYLMVSVPNFSSLECQYFGSAWFHLDVPRHLYHFTETWLTDFVTGLGFNLTWKKQIAPEYDFYSLLQSGLNKIFPHKPNLLYHILLREQKKRLQDYLEIIPQIPAILLMSVLALFITPLLWLIGGSGTIELVFQKNKFK